MSETARFYVKCCGCGGMTWSKSKRGGRRWCPPCGEKRSKRLSAERAAQRAKVLAEQAESHARAMRDAAVIQHIRPTIREREAVILQWMRAG